jgi:hypothetical protein
MTYAYIYAYDPASLFFPIPPLFFGAAFCSPAHAMPAAVLSPARRRALAARYQRCQAQLASLDWITEGSVSANPSPGTWRWTRKIHAKTVSVALSPAQAAAFRQAIARHRRLERLIREMRALSQEFLLGSIPGPKRRPRPNAVPKPA